MLRDAAGGDLSVLVVLVQGTASAAAEPVLQDVVVAPGAVSSASTMALAPDGRIFVAEQAGRLRVIKDDALLSTPFLTVPVTSDGERGLLGVDLRPRLRDQPLRLRLLHGREPGREPRRALHGERANPDVADPASAQVILDNIPLAVRLPQRRRAALRARRQALHRGRREPHGGNAQSAQLDDGQAAPRSTPTARSRPTTRSTRHRQSAIWALGLRNPFTFDIEPGDRADLHQRRRPGHLGGDQRGVRSRRPRTTAGRPPRARRPTRASRRRSTTTRTVRPAARSPAARSTTRRRRNFPAELRRRLLLRRLCGGWIERRRPDDQARADRFATGIAGAGRIDVGRGRQPLLPRARAGRGHRRAGSSTPAPRRRSPAPAADDGLRRRHGDLHRRRRGTAPLPTSGSATAPTSPARPRSTLHARRATPPTTARSSGRRDATPSARRRATPRR